jgi:cobalt-zinc-cadmium efflux system protein
MTSGVLAAAVGATFLLVIAELVGGYFGHSISLVSDALHNLSDIPTLLISWVALHWAAKPADHERTYGYQRAGVLAAFLNALTLIVIAGGIAVEAVHRLSSPVTVQPRLMMIVAAAGVVMNGVIAAFLFSGSRDINIRSTFIHMLGDTLSTAAVIIGGAAILFTHLNWIDPVLSLLIAALILWSSISIVRESMNILLEGTPRGLSVPEIRDSLATINGVLDIHDLHVWSLGSQTRALATHVTIDDIPPSESNRILGDIREHLLRRYGIYHTTVQFEHAPCGEAHGCVEAVEEAHDHSQVGHQH